jgi:hypothetical protein
VEHRGDRHVHVVPVQAALAGALPRAAAVARVCSTSWRWLKYALRQAGGAGGVEGGGLGVLVEIGEVVVGRRRRQQGLVLTGQGTGATAAGASSISTKRFTVSRRGAMAARMGRNSAFTSTTSARAWLRVYRICSGVRRTFTVCRMAPIIGTAKKHSR